MKERQVTIQRPDHNGKKQRPRVAIHFTKPTRTKQEFQEECDINTIMGRAKALKRMQDPTLVNTNYGDGTPYDFHAAMNYVTEAQQQFDKMPSAIRNKFNNDPGAMIDFVNNPENEEEMREMGMLVEKEPDPDPSPEPPPITPPAVDPAPPGE